MGRETAYLFLCDAMLGKLCRWIRFLGFDCLYAGVEMPDREVADLAEREKRWLLTRDRELASKGPRTFLIETVSLENQLAEVFTRLRISPDLSLNGARCSHCNGVLIPVQRDAVQAAVPPHVLSSCDSFRQCSSCGRVYWPGSHLKKIRDRLEHIFPPEHEVHEQVESEWPEGSSS